MIASKYANPEVGRRNLEILAAATLEATLLQPSEPAPRPEYLAAMEELSTHAYRAYRNLVYETTGFERYFWESTLGAGRLQASHRFCQRRAPRRRRLSICRRDDLPGVRVREARPVRDAADYHSVDPP